MNSNRLHHQTITLNSTTLIFPLQSLLRNYITTKPWAIKDLWGKQNLRGLETLDHISGMWMKTYLNAHFRPFKIKLRTCNITWKLRVKAYIQLLHKFKESDKNSKIHPLAESSFHTLNKSWEKRKEIKKGKKKSTGLLPETFRTWNEHKSAHMSSTTHRSWITVTSKHLSKWDQHKSLMASSDILDLCIFLAHPITCIIHRFWYCMIHFSSDWNHIFPLLLLLKSSMVWHCPVMWAAEQR